MFDVFLGQLWWAPGEGRTKEGPSLIHEGILGDMHPLNTLIHPAWCRGYSLGIDPNTHLGSPSSFTTLAKYLKPADHLSPHPQGTQSCREE